MRAHIEVLASCGGSFATVLLDLEDFERLDGRALSIGSHGYAQMWNRPGVILLHRWLMGVPEGTGYRSIVDHINRDPLDCRRSNLRLVTPSVSNLNRRIRDRDLPHGVHLTRSGRYAARLKRHRVTQYLGTFDTVAEAAGAVEAARIRADSGSAAA